jgi:general secretion pathway protein E/type IV pilus assembly protein PilB
MGIKPFMVASSVRAFQAQRLVRTLCPFCKQPNHYEDSYLSAIGFPLENKDKLFRAVGCRSCRNTGFSGRLAIMEICLMTERLQNKINERANAMELKAQALADGMIPMRQYGYRKVAEGITTLEEVLTVTAASE